MSATTGEQLQGKKTKCSPTLFLGSHSQEQDLVVTFLDLDLGKLLTFVVIVYFIHILSLNSPVLLACLSAGPSDLARCCWSGGWTSCGTSSSAWPGGRRCSRSPPACLWINPESVGTLE